MCVCVYLSIILSYYSMFPYAARKNTVSAIRIISCNAQKIIFYLVTPLLNTLETKK